MRAALAITAALVILALGAAAALASSAHGRIVTFDPWQVGLDAAAEKWGPLGCPVVFRRFATQRALAGDSPDDGWGTLAWAAREWDFDAPADEAETCVVAYGPDLAAENPGSQCATIVHEVGHLHGKPHTDSFGVMNPFGVDWRDLPVCAKRIGAVSARWCRARSWGRRSCGRLTTWYVRGPERTNAPR